MYVLSLVCLFFVQFSRCVPLNFVKFRFQYLISQILKSTFNYLREFAVWFVVRLSATILPLFKSGGGPKWTRLFSRLYSASLREIVSFLTSSLCQFFFEKLVGQSGLEPPTSRLSVVCSNQLSYWPVSWEFLLSRLVEISGIEPLTSCLQSRRSPSWAKPPYLLFSPLRLSLRLATALLFLEKTAPHRDIGVRSANLRYPCSVLIFLGQSRSAADLKN